MAAAAAAGSARPAKDEHGDIHIYAELLPNLRQLSLAVSLPSSADSSTSAAIAAAPIPGGSQRVVLRIGHRGAAQEVSLPPSTAAAAAAARLTPARAGTVDLAWRVPLGGAPVRGDASGDDAAPWSAAEMVRGSGVRCRGCKGEVVPAERIGAWKDLPSENWAEMMEFWHCHKPDHDHHHRGRGHTDGPAATTNGDGDGEDKLASKKGYGANAAVRAQEGVGFVDLSGFLFAEEDCEGVVYSPATFDQGSSDRKRLPDTAQECLQNLNVFCASCRIQLGHFSFRTMGITLFKWRIDCQTQNRTASSPTTSVRMPAVSHCLSAILIATLARSGSAKSLIMPTATTTALASATPASSQAIHVWILNSNIVYASSALNEPVAAIKLLYRIVSVEDADRMLESLSSDVQDVGLPEEAVGSVLRELTESNGLLPAKERVFREWKVGLLERWVGAGA